MVKIKTIEVGSCRFKIIKNSKTRTLSKETTKVLMTNRRVDYKE